MQTLNAVLIAATCLLITALEAQNFCMKNYLCSSDADCFGGRCIGPSVSKCLCECLPLRRCKNDVGCGNLRSACQDGFCQCENAYKQAGYNSIIDAYTRLCFQKPCDDKNETEACIGMSCGTGLCLC